MSLRRIALRSVSSILLIVHPVLGTAHAQTALPHESVAGFNSPRGVAIDRGGNVYVADYYNNTIRKIEPAGVVTTLAGSARLPGTADGTGSEARFDHPSGLATDSDDNIYVADSGNHTIRKITPTGTVTTLAGSAHMAGSADGTGNAARFNQPEGVATDRTGNLYVADSVNRTIRKITASGIVTTLAGSAGNRGSTDGTGGAARFDSPAAVATDGDGNVYVSEMFNNTIRKITPSGAVTTLAGVPGFFKTGSADGTGSAARFTNPAGIATDRDGNIYVADWVNATIRKITPAGVVTTFAGLPSKPKTRQGGRCCNVNGVGSAARFAGPYGLATDSAGNIYVADTFDCTIRKITREGMVSTIAGSAGICGSADGFASAVRPPS
jgi:sugar lactone lactonase YvrE